jgi:hypothetical protein
MNAYLCMCKWMQAVAELLLIVKTSALTFIVAVLMRDVWNVMVCKVSSLCFSVHWDVVTLFYLQGPKFFFPSNIIFRISSWFVTLLLSHQYVIARLKLSNMYCVVPQLEWMILPLIYVSFSSIITFWTKGICLWEELTLTFSKFSILAKNQLLTKLLEFTWLLFRSAEWVFGLPGRYHLCWGQTFGGGDSWLPICRPWTLLICVAQVQSTDHYSKFQWVNELLFSYFSL